MNRLVYSIGKGLELVEFWERSDFHGRFNMFVPADDELRPVADPAQLEVWKVDDDCIICDYCNADLFTFPVPVVHGSALCPDCFKSLNPRPVINITVN